MMFPARAIVERIKREYPSGTRVVLVEMNDPYRTMPEGLKGMCAVWMIPERSMWIGTTAVTSASSTAKIPAERWWTAMTETIKKQILAVRDTALTNMFDVNMVQRIANDMGFYELVIYLEDHRREYAHFILTGETE